MDPNFRYYTKRIFNKIITTYHPSFIVSIERDGHTLIITCANEGDVIKYEEIKKFNKLLKILDSYFKSFLKESYHVLKMELYYGKDGMKKKISYYPEYSALWE